MTKKENTSDNTLSNLTNSNGLNIQGLIGFDMSDLPMPYIKLIQQSTKDEDRKKADGTTASVGELYHSLKKDSAKERKFIVIAAKKDTQLNTYNDNNVEEAVVKLLLVEEGDTQPVMAYPKKASLRNWNKYLGSALVSNQDPFGNYLIVSSETYKNQTNSYEYKIFTFSQGSPLTEKDKKLRVQFLNTFSVEVFDKGDGEEDEKVSGERNEVVDPNEIPF